MFGHTDTSLVVELENFLFLPSRGRKRNNLKTVLKIFILSLNGYDIMKHLAHNCVVLHSKIDFAVITKVSNQLTWS
jgi:hypothetical protein